MRTAWNPLGWAVGLALIALPASPLMAEVSTGVMRVSLRVVPAGEALPIGTPVPEPSSLRHPASPNAVLCRSDDHGYRECQTPFRGRVTLSREITATRCVEHRNWGWREGAVWVDQGCGAVFVRVGVN